MYNGLTNEMIVALYLFSCWFEKDLNKNGHKTVKYFRGIHPNANEYFERYVKKMICDNKNTESMQDPHRTFRMTTNECFVFDFCRHLRNSFAHGRLSLNDNLFEIIDYNKGEQTANGTLNSDNVMEFVNMINQYNIENQQ